MKENFSCDLKGSQWWKPFLLYCVLVLAIVVPFELAIFRLNRATQAASVAGIFVLFIVFMFLITVLVAVFTIIFSRIQYPSIGFRGKQFSFSGKVGEFLSLNLVNVLLTIITLGIYLPWYTKKTTDYLVEHSEYDGEKGKFYGTGGKLFKYYLLSLFIPLVVWMLVFIGIFGLVMMTTGNASPVKYALIALAVIVYLSIFLIIGPSTYLMYKWYFNIGWKNNKIVWDTEFWAASGYVIAQIALSIVTLGIFLPALYVNTWRYFAGKTVVMENGTEKGRFGFDGKTVEGFCLIWGQSLLCIITIGIYSPWAYAKCTKYFTNNTYYESAQSRIAQN